LEERRGRGRNVACGNKYLGGGDIVKINYIYTNQKRAYIRLEEERGATRAAWGIESSTPYPMNIIKLFGVIEKNMNRDFGKGLNKLKEICEKS
jgi:hypothetical protein